MNPPQAVDSPPGASAAPNYGFVIDNRRCIGCHACTVACKSEHEDPIGVNKTWVTYIEKGVFPHGRREFHVMRCNHCANAPCVEICPTASLETRSDGIVDFDPGRCIGCKACIQACPYDAIMIHPDSGTATKCNFCAHRVDQGRVPACVSVCPVEAIIPGDLNQPDSPVSRILAEEMTTVRKPEKGTQPNLFYVRGDRAALDPSVSLRSTTTLWGSRPTDGVDEVVRPAHQVEERGAVRRTYDIAQRHAASWGWKVSAYLFTKSIAAGAFLLPAVLVLCGTDGAELFQEGIAWSIFFLAVTGALLVADLQRPERFHWVLLRPQWSSWLVKGAYIITAYGGVLTVGWFLTGDPNSVAARTIAVLGIPLAAGTAAYTGWLFGQAKGRDLWQSALLPLHLLVQALLAGTAFLGVLGPSSGRELFAVLLAALLGVNGLLVAFEIWGRHATRDASHAARIMSTGTRGFVLYTFVFAAGTIAPLLLASLLGASALEFAGLLALVGLGTYEHLWVDAPQRVALA